MQLVSTLQCIFNTNHDLKLKSRKIRKVGIAHMKTEIFCGNHVSQTQIIYIYTPLRYRFAILVIYSEVDSRLTMETKHEKF